MTVIPFNRTTVPASFSAGLVLIAHDLLQGSNLPLPTATQTMAALGASRSRAYASKAQLLEALPGLTTAPGRPSKQPGAPPAAVAEITAAVLDFVLERPGCAHRGAKRGHYVEVFRHFIISLAAQYHVLDITERDEQLGEKAQKGATGAMPRLAMDQFSAATRVPVGTLREWLKGRHVAVDAFDDNTPSHAAGGQPNEPSESLVSSQTATVLHAWRNWAGKFVPFCEHLKRDLKLPFGRALLSRILEAEGKRLPKRRQGRSSDEQALRGQFETFFPGFQWVGDGTSLSVHVAGVDYNFNLELMVDTESGAFVGMSIRDEEDAKAVVDAFEDGVATTGNRPHALLLDNKACNHTDSVDEALGGTTKHRATIARPQNKAHVEGAFGLFAQTAPVLCIPTLEPYQVALAVLNLVFVTWARTLNHKPRPSRNGKSRVELYWGPPPTKEQIAAAQQRLDEIIRREKTARQTRLARLDPDVRALLNDAFERFELSDPKHHIRSAIAGYPPSAIVSGVAVFDGKRKASTLPDSADGRYLLGIVKNISHKFESIAIAESLYDWRVAQRDRIFVRLEEHRAGLENDASGNEACVATFIRQAMKTESSLERHFWLQATVRRIRCAHPGRHRVLFRHAERHIRAVHSCSKHLRQSTLLKLAAMLLPVS